MVGGGGHKDPPAIFRNYKLPKHLYKHVIHVFTSEFHGESNGDGLKALQPIPCEQQEHLHKQHDEGHQNYENLKIFIK